MLRLAELLSNKATEPAPAPDQGLAAFATSAAELRDRLRQITAVEIPASLEAGDVATLGRLRSERAELNEQLGALAEAEMHHRRKNASAIVQAERQKLEDERAEIDATLRAHGEALEALCRKASEVWEAYGLDWERMTEYNQRARQNRSARPEIATDEVVAEQALGDVAGLRHVISRLAAAHARMTTRREWESPAAVARRATAAAQERARHLREQLSREGQRRRGVLQRFTVPITPPTDQRP